METEPLYCWKCGALLDTVCSDCGSLYAYSASLYECWYCGKAKITECQRCGAPLTLENVTGRCQEY